MKLNVFQYRLINSISEILPLVEFYLETDITDEEAERLLMAPQKSNESHPDIFTDHMIHDDINENMPRILDRVSLRAIDSRSVLIVKRSPPFRTIYYRNFLPDLQITICPECHKVSGIIHFLKI